MLGGFIVDAEVTQDELPFFAGSNQKISNALNQVILDPENQALMKKLAGMEESYPQSWHRQTPKGYEPLAMAKKVCDCNCQTTVNNLLESQTSFEE